ncbi:MAG: hypothetical protein HWQ38_35480 [Nostoc sp. NMS7]|nr:hypothetical protein [Nostoc sp. NMS7]MBN3951490.1 hypothetical protein [Nostoc sp. NMS7]
MQNFILSLASLSFITRLLGVVFGETSAISFSGRKRSLRPTVTHLC